MRLLFIMAGPYLLLTVGGVVLWRRYHSVSTLLVPIGFGFMSLHMLGVDSYFGVKFGLMNRPGWIYTYALAQVGLWMAAVGFLWHMSRKQPLVSSNNRLERSRVASSVTQGEDR